MEENSLRQHEKRGRTLCPFYGFNLARGSLIETNSNRCALITNSYSPCYMEIERDNPNWSKCSYNTEKARNELERVAKRIKAFPIEFFPPDRKVWKGMSLEKWIDHISNKP